MRRSFLFLALLLVVGASLFVALVMVPQIRQSQPANRAIAWYDRPGRQRDAAVVTAADQKSLAPFAAFCTVSKDSCAMS
jgi:hypothetical protein